MKWPHLAPNSRRNTARALTNATLAMVTHRPGPAGGGGSAQGADGVGVQLRTSGSGTPPAEMARALAWLERNTREVGDLAEPAVVRAVLDALALRVDGTTGRARHRAASARGPGERRRVRGGAQAARPTTRSPRLPWKAPRTCRRWTGGWSSTRSRLGRCSPRCAGRSRAGRRWWRSSGPCTSRRCDRRRRRPCARRTSLLPAEGWGELLLESSTPEAGASWTDSGRRREERQLKHRAKGETRVVPCAPELTALLHEHLETFGTGPDGLLFRGVRGGQLAESTYCRTWRRGPGGRADGRGGGVAARRAGPTTCGTPRCRRGSTPACPPRRSPSGPATASPCCCRSTPSASPARRTRPGAASPMPSGEG